MVYYSLGNFTSADDDIARTPKGEEEFDNAYQFGLLSTLDVIIDNDILSIDNVKTEIIVNYFIKFVYKTEKSFDWSDEKNHYRYSYGLTKEFIVNTYNKVIQSDFR